MSRFENARPFVPGEALTAPKMENLRESLPVSFFGVGSTRVSRQTGRLTFETGEDKPDSFRIVLRRYRFKAEFDDYIRARTFDPEADGGSGIEGTEDIFIAKPFCLRGGVTLRPDYVTNDEIIAHLNTWGGTGVFAAAPDGFDAFLVWEDINDCGRIDDTDCYEPCLHAFTHEKGGTDEVDYGSLINFDNAVQVDNDGLNGRPTSSIISANEDAFYTIDQDDDQTDRVFGWGHNESAAGGFASGNRLMELGEDGRLLIDELTSLNASDLRVRNVDLVLDDDVALGFDTTAAGLFFWAPSGFGSSTAVDGLAIDVGLGIGADFIGSVGFGADITIVDDIDMDGNDIFNGRIYGGNALTDRLIFNAGTFASLEHAGSVLVVIDSDGNSTAQTFEIWKDAPGTGGTQIAELTEDGVWKVDEINDLTAGEDLTLRSRQNMDLVIDSDNNQSDREFNWLHNVGTQIMNLTEAGVLSIDIIDALFQIFVTIEKAINAPVDGGDFFTDPGFVHFDAHGGTF